MPAHVPVSTTSRSDAQVLVIGSANIDVSVRTDRLPSPGETRAGSGSLISVGGKGANQAAAAALAGAQTRFVACTGDDDFARRVLGELAAREVLTDECRRVTDLPTGLASILVDDAGQNVIVVVAGANAALAPDDIDRIAPRIRSAAALVLQCEIPWETNVHAVRLAAACGTPVIFNPAPCRDVDLAALLPGVTYLVPNETEAAALTGMPASTPAQAAECARHLVARGFPCVIVTLGAAGCVCADAQGVTHVPAPTVDAIDTTGAGDAFMGCFAAALASGEDRHHAIGRALAYASLATTRRGALVSYPSEAEMAAALADGRLRTDTP